MDGRKEGRKGGRKEGREGGRKRGREGGRKGGDLYQLTWSAFQGQLFE